MKAFFFASSVVALAATAAGASKPLLVYEIDLDLDPSERYAGLFDLNPTFNETVWKFYEQSFANNALLTDVLYSLSDRRGPENDEMQAEIESLAAMSRLPLPFVQSIQMLYELQTIMVPIVNFTSIVSLAEYDPAASPFPHPYVIATAPAKIHEPSRTSRQPISLYSDTHDPHN